MHSSRPRLHLFNGAKTVSFDTGPSAFPLLRAALSDSRRRRFQEALDAIATGVSAGSIRKVELDAAKHDLSAAVNDAYDRSVGERFTYRGQYESLSDAQRELDASISGLKKKRSNDDCTSEPRSSHLKRS